jgi:hypothetical protein
MATSEVAQCLAATLSPEANTRIAAELKLSELFTRPGAYPTISSFQISLIILFTAFCSRLQKLRYLFLNLFGPRC